MAEQKPNNAGPMDSDLDRILDAALAKYSAVEPRAGLEGRILANLRAERAPDSVRSWWRWSLAAVVAAVFVIALAMAFRPGKSSKPTIASHPDVTVQPAHEPEQRFANGDHGTDRNAPKPVRKHRNRPDSAEIQVAARTPKLDQFPSPQPLSEQEQILASYVHNYPKDAALMAEARMESLQRDQEEIQREMEADSNENSRTR